MTAEEAWTRSICHDVQQDITYVIPYNHTFCIGCIRQWVKLRDSCPRCRMAMQTIQVPVQEDDEYVECIVSPPALPMPIGFGTATATGPDSVEASLSPTPLPSLELMVAEPERVGSLLPEEWAALFKVRQDTLDPVLPWLEQQLSHIEVLHWWQINWLKKMIVSHLCQVGLDRNALAQCLQGTLGPITIPFPDMVIEATQRLCAQKARKLLGLEHPSAAHEQEDGTAAPSSPAATHQGTAALSTTPSSSSAGTDVEELPSTSS